MNAISRTTGLCLISLALAGMAHAQAPGAAAPAKIGKMTVHAAEGRAEVAGAVCLGEGILDYLICPPESGKEYETLLRMEAAPSELHAALLALGLRTGAVPAELRGEDRGAPKDTQPPERVGDRVTIAVRWGPADAPKEAPVESWLIDRSTGRAPKEMNWIFSGSFFARGPDGREAYAGDVERLGVAMLYHGACVLNLGVTAGNPYRGADQGYEINKKAVPPIGTPVRIIFRAAGKKKG